jgi:hypothetical protein
LVETSPTSLWTAVGVDAASGCETSCAVEEMPSCTDRGKDPTASNVIAIMPGALAAVIVALLSAGGDPADCTRGTVCREGWRKTFDGVEVRVVESYTADVHMSDREATETIYIRGAEGWLWSEWFWSTNDVEMSTASTRDITHRRIRSALADGRSAFLIQIDFRDESRDRGPPWSTTVERGAYLVACIVDASAPACSKPIALRCGKRCNEARWVAGELVWTDLDGSHREPLVARYASAQFSPTPMSTTSGTLSL